MSRPATSRPAFTPLILTSLVFFLEELNLAFTVQPVMPTADIRAITTRAMWGARSSIQAFLAAAGKLE